MFFLIAVSIRIEYIVYTNVHWSGIPDYFFLEGYKVNCFFAFVALRFGCTHSDQNIGAIQPFSLNITLCLILYSTLPILF